MKSTSVKNKPLLQIATVASELRVTALPWWGVLMVDVACAIIFAVVVYQGMVTGPGVTWHIAAIVGVAVGELILAVAHLICSLRWRGYIVDDMPVAYEAFNSYLMASETPLDQKNVPAAATLIGDLVTRRGMNAHLWHAATSALLCVPAWISVLAAATEQGATREQMTAFLAPMFVVVGLSTLTLLVSLVGLMVQQAGISEWITEVSSRRITATTWAIDEKLRADDVTTEPLVRRRKPPEERLPQMAGGASAVQSRATEDGMPQGDWNSPAGINNDQPYEQTEFPGEQSAEGYATSRGDGHEHEDAFDEEPIEEAPPVSGRRKRDNSRFGE
jgi:hypothetical protein